MGDGREGTLREEGGRGASVWRTELCCFLLHGNPSAWTNAWCKAGPVCLLELW